MASVNRVIIVGRLGKDPEVKAVGDRTVCSFSLATSERFKASDGTQKESTEWHSIQVWGKQAEACGKYLAKGREVYVEGKLKTRSWEKDGQKHYKTEINAEHVVFLGGKPASDESAGGDPDSDPGQF